MTVFSAIKNFFINQVISRIHVRVVLVILTALCAFSVLFHYFTRDDSVSVTTVLGVIVVLFLVLHFTHFWMHMQLQSFLGKEGTDPYQLVVNTFSNPVICVLYVIWFAAIYFHISHGFWSAFQSIGLNNSKWLPRLQFLAKLYAICVFLGFTLIPVYFLCCKCCCCAGSC